MDLLKELSAWSSTPHQAVLAAGEEVRASPHHSSEPAGLREEGWQATAAGG